MEPPFCMVLRISGDEPPAGIPWAVGLAGTWLYRNLWQDRLDEAHREEAPWLLMCSLAFWWISVLFYRCVYCELKCKLRLENMTTKIV